MRDLLARLYATVSLSARRRLRLAAVGLLVVSGLEMVGLLLILPLMQMLTGASTHTGLLGHISDLLGNPSDSTLALTMASVVFVAFVTKGLFTLAFRWWVLGFTNRLAADASTELLRRYLGAPYAFHLHRNTAEMLRTMSDAVNKAYLGVVNNLLAGLSESVTIGAIALVVLVARPIPALGAIAYFGVVGIVFQRLVGGRSQRAGTQLLESTRATIQAALQGLGGIKEVQVRGGAEHFVSVYHRARLQTATASRESLYLGEAPRYALEMLFIVGVAVMSGIIFAGSGAKQGAATLGLFVAAGFRILPSMVRLLAASSGLRVGQEGLRLVLADLDELPAVPTEESSVEPLHLDRALRLDDVHFRYPASEHAVLDGVSLTLPAGRSLAIVGSSGAGKTTLVDLILGLHQPTSGRITVDGTDLTAVMQRWQRAIGLVPQDVFLLDDSLRANIAYGLDTDEIDADRLAEAVERAQLDELVDHLPEGLDTFVGERGARISGGQRQRIGIARALYLRPQLLVLDEATSSLDNETERRITETIESLHGQLTMIVVAHRLSTVRRCDELIFMHGGRIQSRGTFDEVRASNATFAALVELGSLSALDTGAPGSAEETTTSAPTKGANG